MDFLSSPILEAGLWILAGFLVLIALIFFGSGLIETVVAIFRLFFSIFGGFMTAVGHSIVALGWYLLGGLVLLLLGASWLAYLYWFKPGELNLARYRPPVCTELLDRKGAVLDYLCPFDGVRIWRPISAISAHLRMLVVMLEDDKFYEHGGLDVDEIWNSLEQDIEKRKFARGASTITQQLAKNLFLTKEKSVIRKASEVPLALRLEREFSKDQILELYLNTIEWGPGVYGAEAASRLYFDHDAASLAPEEAWLLALMIPNPKELNPWVNPRSKKSLLKRANHLSKRLYIEHRMSKDAAEETLGKFESFLERWMTRKPMALQAGRAFPAKWALSKSFSLSEVVSIRRGAAGLMKRFKQSPLKSNLDREMQKHLEARLAAAVAHLHSHDLSDVVAIMEGEQIRALLPVSSQQFVTQVATIASEQGYTAKVFPARNIPKAALWP